MRCAEPDAERLELAPARWPAALGLAYVICLPAAVACSGGDWLALRVLAATCGGGLLLSVLRRDLLRQGPEAPRALRWGTEGLKLDLAGGRHEAVRLCHGSFGTTRFLWLVLRGRRCHRVFIDGAAADPAAWAALRRWLRCRPTVPGGMG